MEPSSGAATKNSRDSIPAIQKSVNRVICSTEVGHAAGDSGAALVGIAFLGGSQVEHTVVFSR